MLPMRLMLRWQQHSARGQNNMSKNGGSYMKFIREAERRRDRLARERAAKEKKRPKWPESRAAALC